MNKSRVDTMIRDQWRELRFYYDRDDTAREWRLIGGRIGLLTFSERLTRYAADPRHALPSEHEHYGPYMYLKVMTWPTPGINEDSIHGPVEDLRHLAAMIAEKVMRMKMGEITKIKSQYAAEAAYAIVLELRADDFDPASLDPSLQNL